MKSISIIGAGLSGSEAALAAARLGVQVHLYEMRPQKMTPAHHTGNFAELVCSNSLGGEGNTNAKGLLQAEIAHAGSLIMEAAHKARVPAGGALAVARESFSEYITEQIKNHPLIKVYAEEVSQVPEGIVVLASGPLTSDALAEDLKRYTDGEHLSFYDAAAPVIAFESINMDIAYRKGRYDQEADYINCPMDRDQYDHWYNTIQEARQHTPHDWEKLEFFEGCMPIEEIARRGKDTPRFGPMKPRGLHNPRTDREPYAVVQLRQEDQDGRMWSLVGFQTGLKWGDQKTMVQSIPGLEEADIVRYGVMHRNTYLCAPKVLLDTLQLQKDPNVLVAGVCQAPKAIWKAQPPDGLQAPTPQGWLWVWNRCVHPKKACWAVWCVIWPVPTPKASSP